MQRHSAHHEDKRLLILAAVLALLAGSCAPAREASPPAKPPSKPETVALNLSRATRMSAYLAGKEMIVTAARSAAKVKKSDLPKFLQRVRQENLNGQPFPSGKGIHLLVCSRSLNKPDIFRVTSASRTGKRIAIRAEQRGFDGWDGAPEARKTNTIRTAVVSIPLGVLADGEYDVELAVRHYSFKELGKPEKAELIDRSKMRLGRGTGPVRCVFAVGKRAKPRLVEVSQLVRAGANRTFHFNGRVNAGHLSGGPKSPRVYMEKTWASRKEIEDIWKAARALDLKALVRKYPPASRKRSITLRLAMPDGTNRRYDFPMEAPELKELNGLLSKKGYGAW